MAKRICILGSQQYVSGLVNGVFVDAIPDTGADVCCMSATFARKFGFEVDTSEENCIALELADGTTAMTTGLAMDVTWEFLDTPGRPSIDVYVLPDLPVDFVLSYDFLCSTNAFVDHESTFWYDDDREQADNWSLSVIRVASNLVKGARSAFSSTSVPTISSDPEEVWRNRKGAELEAYRNAKKHAHDLPDDEQSAYLEPYELRWRHFLEARPGYGTDKSSSSQSSRPQRPPPLTNTSLQISNAVAAISLPGRQGFFSKIRMPKRKARPKANVTGLRVI